MQALKITNVKNGTKPSEEYIELHANQNVELHNYAILDNTFDANGGLSNLHRHFYRLPNFSLKKGEWVRIWTGVGTLKPETGKLSSGAVYKLTNVYWGLKACIWNNSAKDRATLIHFTVIDGKTV